ncbi:MAG: winged helix-turn-helix domain-containing protein [Acidobacteriaceae bacterium]
MAVALYQFGDFQLDCGRLELLQSGQPVRLERKPMELLLLLLASNGHLVTRTEIAERLWSKEVFVDTEHGINTAVRKIRRVLGDDPDRPRFVQTVTGKGYRFSVPIVAIPVATGPTEPTLSTPAPFWRRPSAWYVAAAVCAASVVLGIASYRYGHRAARVAFTQITDFTDSAVAPALSHDGHMVAFIRGSDAFLSPDQIYLKVLPDGEDRRLTDDPRPKYGLAFSPDGSEVAYSVFDRSGFATYAVPVTGGESHLLLSNAAGLVWLNPHELLFSEAKSGIHLGVVTASETRSGLHEIYFPPHERSMAHYSYPSPNRLWALVVEMDENGKWSQCRLVSLNGNDPPRPIGTAGACTSAGWSPDNSWMYFTATIKGSSHIWRERFPDGEPQQVTFGPTEEQGIAVEPSGRSLITSIGLHESTLWIHDPGGGRPLSAEGEVVTGESPPSFNSDNSAVYYLWRRREGDSDAELWRASVKSGKSESVLPGIAVISFDLSPDGRQVVYATSAPGGTTKIWLAPVDRSTPPRRIGGSGGTNPHFGPRGLILYQQSDGKANFLKQMNPDGSNSSKVVPDPIIDFQGVSPGRRWAIAAVPIGPQRDGAIEVAIPLNGGPPRRVCAGYCVVTWSTDGQFLFIQVEPASSRDPGRTLAIPVGQMEDLSDLPPGGIAPFVEPIVGKGYYSIPHGNLVPGRDREHFAYVVTTTHRNLYRVSLGK